MWVRTATKRDINSIQKLLAATWHSTYDAIYGAQRVSEITAEWHSQEALDKQLAAPKSEFLVADDGSQIAGIAYARQVSDSEIKLHQLYVALEHQGKGVGKMLLDEVEESFFDVPNIVLEVEDKNAQAIAFYRTNGFNQTGVTRNCGKQDSGIAASIFTKQRF